MGLDEYNGGVIERLRRFYSPLGTGTGTQFVSCLLDLRLPFAFFKNESCVI